MLLVGLENCKPCEELHKKYPNVPFVENGLSFTDEVERWGCNKWEATEGEE